MLYSQALNLRLKDAQDIWHHKIDNVDVIIGNIQDSKSQSTWALEFWQNVRLKLTRQLNLMNYDKTY